MRLDKFLTDQTDLTRSLAGRAIRRGEVMVDGFVVTQASFHINPESVIEYNGAVLRQQGPRYLMLHKPVGYVCSNNDPDHPILFDLLDEPMGDLHVAGRLDLDTTGLVLISDDGQWTHRITSPRRECSKRYLVELADPISSDAIALFAEGIQLKSEPKPTLPAQLEIIDSHHARLTIHEGRYHQVKRMFAALGNRVVTLHREAIGTLILDPNLAEGEYRPLTAEEIALF